jgi:lipopolysaccharide export system permease protein
MSSILKIWERYLLTRLFFIALFILIGLFGMFMLIDLSIHSVRFFSDGQARLIAILLYYIHSFSMYFDLFCTLAFLLSMLKVLFDFTHHFEWVALQMAGLSRRRLSRPFLVIACLFSFLSYANMQYLAPRAQDSIDSFRNQHAKRKKHAQREYVHALTLDDGTQIVYQRFNVHTKTLFDVYWIKSVDEFWHLKEIDLNQTPPVAHCVDRFERNDEGKIIMAESSQSYSSLDLPMNAQEALQKFIPFENRSISALFLQARSPSSDIDMIQAHLHYKLTLPMIPVLFALALPPAMLRFSRHMPFFLIAACSLFALISVITIWDGMLILAENRVVHPILASWGPLLVCFAVLVRRFRKG